MTALGRLLDESERDPTAAARRARAAGKPVIGFVGADIPVELIDAAGAFALSLGQCLSAQTPQANRYLEASFAPLERSIAERWLRGELDFADAVIFSRGSDSSQRLYYYLCELQRHSLTRGPRPLLYDLAKIPRSSSAAYCYRATLELAGALGTDSRRLHDGIARRNRRRQLLKALQQSRAGAALPRGTLCERIGRLADCCEPDDFDQALTLWLGTPSEAASGPRLLLMGSAPGHGMLHAAIEEAGAVVVEEVGDHNLMSLGAAIPATIDPLRALSDHYHALPYGARAFIDRAADLGRRIAACPVDGVLIWLLEEEEALVWDLPAQQQLLQQLRLPTLTLTRQRATPDDQTLQCIREFSARLPRGE